MNNKNNLGFTFVEMIIAISIVVLLAVIGNSSLNSHKEKSNNAKVISDLGTLNNSLLSYVTENKILPKSGGNDNFFKEDTSYSHSWTSTGTYGAHGFITNNTIPKKYLNYLPLDPITNQFYAYGRTKADMQFEVAGVIFNNGEPLSLVDGDYTAENGPYNLIREYNGPDFVYDKSLNNFPYNPYKKVLVAKINDFSGAITDIKINNKLMNTDSLLSYNLKKGDKISVSTGSTVDIFFSDGTTSTLGDMTKRSEITLSDMSFGGENNLITRIKLALGVGTIWSQATSLGTNSEFNIYTTDSSAAVRGTVFGISKATDTNVVVLDGNVDIKKIEPNIKNIESLSNNISKNIPVEIQQALQIENIIAGGGLTASKSSLNNNTVFSQTPSSQSTTNLISQSTTNLISQSTLNKVGRITNAIQINMDFYEKTTNSINIKLKLNKILKQKAKFLKLKIGRIEYKLKNNWENKTELTLTGGTIFTNINNSSINTLNHSSINTLNHLISGKNKIKISFCKERYGKIKCTKTKTIKIIDGKFSSSDTKKCSRGKEHFNHECITQLKDWKLLAYAPYTSNTNLYKKDGTIVTSSSSGITFDGTGILINNKNSYISYSGIDLTNFRIKMKLKGLNNNTNNYLMFKSGSIKLGNYKTGITFKNNNTGINDFDISSLDNNKYYEIIVEQYNNYLDMKINSSTGYNLYSIGTTIKQYTSNISDLFIGNNNNKNNGFSGGIIDYIKIYKKD